jgi:hypothetical protein
VAVVNERSGPIPPCHRNGILLNLPAGEVDRRRNAFTTAWPFAENSPTWTTFNAQSMLGDALNGQKKYAEAEPLLVSGHAGLKQREAKIPTQGKVRLTEAVQRLIDLYTAWDKPNEAAKWQTALAEHQADNSEKPDKHP